MVSQIFYINVRRRNKNNSTPKGGDVAVYQINVQGTLSVFLWSRLHNLQTAKVTLRLDSSPSLVPLQFVCERRLKLTLAGFYHFEINLER